MSSSRSIRTIWRRRSRSWRDPKGTPTLAPQAERPDHGAKACGTEFLGRACAGLDGPTTMRASMPAKLDELSTATAAPIVLIVEDDPETRHFYRSIFEQDGFRIEQAHNGLQAF